MRGRSTVRLQIVVIAPPLPSSSSSSIQGLKPVLYRIPPKISLGLVLYETFIWHDLFGFFTREARASPIFIILWRFHYIRRSAIWICLERDYTRRIQSVSGLKFDVRLSPVRTEELYPSLSHLLQRDRLYHLLPLCLNALWMTVDGTPGSHFKTK